MVPIQSFEIQLVICNKGEHYAIFINSKTTEHSANFANAKWFKHLKDLVGVEVLQK